MEAGLGRERLLGEADVLAVAADDAADARCDRWHVRSVAAAATRGLQTIVCKARPISYGVRYRVRSVGAWGDLHDVRSESVERLAFALAIFGAEATLRQVAGAGTVTLYDSEGRELLSYEGERLAVLGGAYFGR